MSSNPSDIVKRMQDRSVPGIDFLDDNAAEALACFPTLKRRCLDCAYTLGTDAFCHPITGPLAQECVEARHAFWCHKTIADDFSTHLCAGWVDLTNPDGRGE